MTLFYLPDLGEGLPDAEIRHWYIKLGEAIKADMPMVAMETAKAVVDIPAPFSGKVMGLYGKSGDIIKVGEALIDIEGEEKAQIPSDKLTVVGTLHTGNTIIEESAIGIQTESDIMLKQNTIKASPAIRALAKKMQIELAHCLGTGPAGQITVSDLEIAKKTKITTAPSTINSQQLGFRQVPWGCEPSGNTAQNLNAKSLPSAEGYEPLRGVRRTMAIAMSQSHQSVVPVTLVDDANIHSWPEKTDITLRLIRAIVTACQREPRLNSWFDDSNLSLHQHPQINLGIAMDTPEGLFVPVLKNVAQSSLADCRKKIDQFKPEVRNRSIHAENLNDATLVLSNVGIFAGRYATPIITPPMVAILAVGRIIEGVVAEKGKPAIHKLLPVSLTVDHRAITGGEAARFLSELIRDLQTP